MPILKPLSGVTTSVVNAATTSSLGTMTSAINGAPPTRILGEFAGCPSPGISQMPLSADAIANVTARTNVHPPWVRVIPRWSVMPGPESLTATRAF
jgi:hypothetical protein